ncbi:MAG: hypothetical protein DRI57_15795 [Deltaproteobacteria bacterium]|nr:MAG: hypothetical protein DRI57_15795 [Deltaproteobacteria bacterium]
MAGYLCCFRRIDNFGGFIKSVNRTKGVHFGTLPKHPFLSAIIHKNILFLTYLHGCITKAMMNFTYKCLTVSFYLNYNGCGEAAISACCHTDISHRGTEGTKNKGRG